ncbi:flippase [Gracilimonas sp.]|uniref:flippase n=1 Tax=Gracilimonas sp. TaxID=1974203 RepID=UPI003D0D9A5A
MLNKSQKKLTDGRLLVRNVGFNFLSKIFPLLAGVISIPLLISNIGTEKFGVLAILWLLIGYFGILDFGFSKSIVYELGKDLRAGIGDISETTGTITTVLILSGSFFGTLIILVSPYLVKDVFQLGTSMQNEVLYSFIILGIGTPVTMITSALRGILETFQEFKKISVIDTLGGGFNYLGLAAISFFSTNMIVLIIALIIIKLLIGATFYFYCKKLVSGSIFTFKMNTEKLKSAFDFGKWIAVSNVINPIMGQIDRYIIGAVLTMSAITFYTAPFDMIQKINLIPISITAVLFPAFTLAGNSVKKSSLIFSNSILATIILVFPLAGILIFFAEEILFIWLGQEFVDESTLVLQILIVGAFVNCIAKIPFTFIQGLGQPNVTAKLHLGEFVGYVPILWFLINTYGILGAAFARAIRVFVDWFALTFIANKKIHGKSFILETLALTGALIAIYFASTFSIGLVMKVISTVMLMGVYFSLVWNQYLDQDTKALFLNKLSKILKR